MKNTGTLLVLLPFLLFSQTYDPLGKTGIFLNSFLNIHTFPSSINGYTDFISLSGDAVSILYKSGRRGIFVSTAGRSIYTAANLTEGFWDLGIMGSYSSDTWSGIFSLGYNATFSRTDISVSVEDGKFDVLNFKFEKELSSQKMLGAWITAGDSVSLLLDLMVTPTENRIFFLGAGGNSREILVTAGGYFPISSWLYMELSGDFVREKDSTYVQRRWGLAFEFSDFLAEFQLNPRLLGYAPYFLTGHEADPSPLISVSFMYRFHTF